MNRDILPTKGERLFLPYCFQKGDLILQVAARKWWKKQAIHLFSSQSSPHSYVCASVFFSPFIYKIAMSTRNKLKYHSSLTSLSFHTLTRDALLSLKISLWSNTRFYYCLKFRVIFKYFDLLWKKSIIPFYWSSLKNNSVISNYPSWKHSSKNRDF